MECFTWLNVNNEWDGASDTRRQNGWQNNDLFPQNHDGWQKSPPLPPISMLNDRFPIPDSEAGLHTSTLKKGERGDFVKGPLCGVLRFVPVPSKNFPLFWVLPRYFVVGCLRRHPIHYWHSVMWSAPFYRWCKLWARKRFRKNFRKFPCNDVMLWRHYFLEVLPKIAINSHFGDYCIMGIPICAIVKSRIRIRLFI